MRILLTTDTVGGVWTFTRELTVQLLQRGHDVALVSFGRFPSAAQLEWSVQTEKMFGHSFSYVPSDAPLEWMQNNDAVLGEDADLLARVAESFHPDLLHSNQFCYGTLDLRIPKLVTAHSDVLTWAEACRPAGLEASPWLHRYQELVSEGLRNADAATAPTQWMADALTRKHAGLPPTHVVRNGRTLQPPRRPRKLQAVSAGRLWDEAKNVSILRDVQSPIPVLVAGEREHEGFIGPAQIGSATLIGSLSELALLKLFSESSIYIAPSIYEPFGFAPLEAALCGCAIVANDIPSFREVWGDAAIYFEDADSLSRVLRDLTSNSGSLDISRAKSSARARQLSADRMADQYEHLYTHLIRSNAGLRMSVPADVRREFEVHVA